MNRNVFKHSLQSIELRQWQKEAAGKAIEVFESERLAVVEACTGAGKSMLGCAVAARMMSEGDIDEVVVICPSVSIQDSWYSQLSSLSLIHI